MMIGLNAGQAAVRRDVAGLRAILIALPVSLGIWAGLLDMVSFAF